MPWIKTEYDLLVEDQGDPFAITERGEVKAINHAFFVAKFIKEHIVLFDSSLQEFYEYQVADGSWRRITVDTLKKMFMDDFKRVAQENRLRNLLGKRNFALASALANYLRGEVEREDAFQRRRDFIHVKNGVLRIEQGKISLVDFDPEFYSRNIAPFEYNLAAQCPRFLGELLEPALCAADISLVQRWAGSVLLGRNIAQRFLLVTGTAGGGKSTLMNVVEAVIGAQNVAQLRTDHLGERFELYRFDGKTLLTGKDVAANFLMRKSAHVIKALVGHDLLEAEKKNSNERVQLRGDFNIAITCNSQLKVRLEGDTGAWERRLLIVNYDRPKPAKPIADFATTLICEEGAGILNWMVEGARLHLAETAEHGDYQLTADQQKRIDMLLSESDSIRKFVEEWVVPAQGESVTSQALLQGYIEYCEHMQWEGFTPEEVKRALPTVMREVYKVAVSHDIPYLGKPARGYRNFALAR